MVQTSQLHHFDTFLVVFQVKIFDQSENIYINKRAFWQDAYHPLANRRCRGPHANKFKQVSRDGHQMTLAGGDPMSDVQREQAQGMGPMSDLQRGARAGARGGNTVRSNESWVMVPQTGRDMSENITFPQF